jgi:hypothetical protein
MHLPFIAFTASPSCEWGAQPNIFPMPLNNAHVRPFPVSTLLTLTIV